ncbi:MAG: cytochrome c oxidase subunit II, partial [Gemmatimonadales bacterium]
MSWWLPPAASTFAGPIDGLFLAILIITGIALVVVEVGLVVFLVRYRGRPGRKAYYTHGSTRAEIIWTAIPVVTMVALGLVSNHYWVQMKSPRSVPADAIQLGVHGKQFEWQMSYPGADGRLGTDDDFMVRNQLHVPVNQPVAVQLTSEDVIHSFFVPEFRVKQDAVPGMHIVAWFQATQTGEYEIGCAELCG